MTDTKLRNFKWASGKSKNDEDVVEDKHFLFFIETAFGMMTDVLAEITEIPNFQGKGKTRFSVEVTVKGTVTKSNTEKPFRSLYSAKVWTREVILNSDAVQEQLHQEDDVVEEKTEVQETVSVK